MKKLVIVLGLLLAVSCDNNTAIPKPAAIGKIGEIMVIVNNPEWDSELGDTIRSIFKKAYPMLLQNENSFDLVQFGVSSFISVMQKHRNILLISISEEFTEAKLTQSKDLWAAPQIVLNAVGKDIRAVADLLGAKRNIMMKLFEQAELNRQSTVAMQYSDSNHVDSVRKRFGVELSIPTGYYLLRNDKDFQWFESQTSSSSVGIFIYTYPVTGENTLNVKHMVAKRDSLLKEKIHGSRDSSWMTTTPFLLPEMEIKKDNNELICGEMRGLWELVNDYMGGPFVSRSYIDKNLNRVITVEGYIYAPRETKRDYIRKVLGIIGTFKMPV